MKRTHVIIATILVAALGLAGCGQQYDDERGVGDAPVMSRRGDDKAAVVINFPNGFENIAIKCYGGTALLTTTRDAAPVVIPKSTLCRGDEVVNLQGKG